MWKFYAYLEWDKNCLKIDNIGCTISTCKNLANPINMFKKHNTCQLLQVLVKLI